MWGHFSIAVDNVEIQVAYFRRMDLFCGCTYPHGAYPAADLGMKIATLNQPYLEISERGPGGDCQDSGEARQVCGFEIRRALVSRDLLTIR